MKKKKYEEKDSIAKRVMEERAAFNSAVETRDNLLAYLTRKGASLDILSEATDNWDILYLDGQEYAVVSMIDGPVYIPANGMSLDLVHAA